MNRFKDFFASACQKAPPAWTNEELHVAFYGPKSETLYEYQDDEVPPVAGDECYRVTITVPTGGSIVLPETMQISNGPECTRCVVGIRVRTHDVFDKAQLVVGSSLISTLYENDGIFTPMILPIPPLHKIEVHAKAPFNVYYTVRKLQNPSDAYRFWYPNEIRKMVDDRLFLNGPVSKIEFIDRSNQTFEVNGRPVPFHGITCSFEPITVDFDEIEVAKIKGRPLEIRATYLQMIEIKKGMLGLPFSR